MKLRNLFRRKEPIQVIQLQKAIINPLPEEAIISIPNITAEQLSEFVYICRKKFKNNNFVLINKEIKVTKIK